MHARIAMMQAIHAGKPAPKEPRRKRAKAYRIIRRGTKKPGTP